MNDPASGRQRLLRRHLELVRLVLSGRVDPDQLEAEAATSRRLIIGAIAISNIVGAAVVVILLGLVLPLPGAARNRPAAGVDLVAGLGALAYVIGALIVGVVVGLRLARPVIDFFRSGREPTEDERWATLRLPSKLLQLQAVLWTVAVLVFGLGALRTSGLYAFEVAITTTLGGIPTSCMAYLLTQRLLRSGVSVVLANTPPRSREVPGVRARSLLAWALGAVPIGGVATVAGFAPFTDTSVGTLARSVLVLSVVSLLVGLGAASVVGRGLAEPLQRLRAAFGKMREGDFDVSVPVTDATEVGFAAASFNEMADGLSERERMRDLFGRQVGSDVAREAMEKGVTLGGAEADAAVLFVDVIGSTAFAADRKPTEVVEALNEFFDAVVEATRAHRGFVNKFIGDAALCVFGVPLELDDPAGSALCAALDMAQRLQGNELEAGIGVAFGTVVAGNVGNAERYEYTVIGDPVNEAARITEAAKSHDGRVLASERTLAAAQDASQWTVVDETTLRGRSRSTKLAAPVSSRVSSTSSG